MPHVSFLISTYNRRAVVLDTLARLAACSADCGIETETIIVDNASTDGSADAIAAAFPDVRLIRAQSNRGACSKNDGLAIARGRYVLFLDDDSFPTTDSLPRMVRHFAANPSLGAAIFTVVLPDGSQECSAYPDVCIGCGTGFRLDALKQVGGLPSDYFMQAEEYDLSIRLLDAGWGIERFDDLLAHHLKTPGARVPTRTTRLDVRNNLTLIGRRFPRQWMLPFAISWCRRYYWIASTKGWRHQVAFGVGLLQGLIRILRVGRRRAVSADAFEQFAKVELIADLMAERVRACGARSILLIDAGKNLLVYTQAAEQAGIRVVGIADSKLAKRGRRFHGIPIVTDEEARRLTYDVAVIANLSPVHAADRHSKWYPTDPHPVLDLMEQPTIEVEQQAYPRSQAA